MKKFNVCEYTHIDFDITGNRWGYWTGIEHALPHNTYIKDSCTQYGTDIMYCSYCGVTEYYDYVEPSHKYEWNGETYVCWDCGLENEKGYDGNFIVEDLTADYDGYTVGFFNRLGEFWEMEDGYNFYIVLNYGMANEVVTEGVLYDLVEYGYDKTGAAGSGIIMIDMDSLNAAIEKAYPNGGFANVSIVFQYFDRDYETGQHSYLDHVITLDRI